MADSAKIMNWEQAAKWRQAMKDTGKKVALANGVFDLLHPGHVYYLREVRRRAEALMVAITADEAVRRLKGPARPIQNETQRAQSLEACDFVDAIVIFPWDKLLEGICTFRPDIYAKGGGYTLESMDTQERQAAESVGAQIEFVQMLEGFSTTEMIERIKAAGRL